MRWPLVLALVTLVLVTAAVDPAALELDVDPGAAAMGAVLIVAALAIASAEPITQAIARRRRNTHREDTTR